MIADTINQKIAEALKAHDEVRLSTLRMLSSALNYEKIAKQHDLSGEEEITVVKREVKKRTDAIDYFRQAQGKATTSTEEELKAKKQKEEKEMEILKEFLPPQLGTEELEKLVTEAIEETGASSVKDMGKVIGLVMAKAKGAADGGKVAELAKSKLITQ